MAAHPFAALAEEYAGWVAHCRPLPERVHEVDFVAHRLTKLGALDHLDRVHQLTDIPIVVMAPIGERECGFDFTKNWGQGDPLTHPSVNEPRGRPPLGAPPNDRFPVTWEYAALDAFTVCDRLNVLSVAEWTLPYACWKWEGYNGFGYRAHGIRTPYVVGGTNLQQRGKYTSDGKFDPAHMDGQLGALPIAMRMIEIVPGLSLAAAIEVAAAPSLPPAVAPVPLGVGGGLTGARWVQASLNLILHLDPPLVVDGSYGKRTRAAVRRAQSELGLVGDGLVDDDLCKAIDARLAEMRPGT